MDGKSDFCCLPLRLPMSLEMRPDSRWLSDSANLWFQCTWNLSFMLPKIADIWMCQFSFPFFPRLASKLNFQEDFSAAKKRGKTDCKIMLLLLSQLRKIASEFWSSKSPTKFVFAAESNWISFSFPLLENSGCNSEIKLKNSAHLTAIATGMQNEEWVGPHGWHRSKDESPGRWLRGLRLTVRTPIQIHRQCCRFRGLLRPALNLFRSEKEGRCLMFLLSIKTSAYRQEEVLETSGRSFIAHAYGSTTRRRKKNCSIKTLAYMLYVVLLCMCSKWKWMRNRGEETGLRFPFPPNLSFPFFSLRIKSSRCSCNFDVRRQTEGRTYILSLLQSSLVMFMWQQLGKRLTFKVHQCTITCSYSLWWEIIYFSPTFQHASIHLCPFLPFICFPTNEGTT